MQESCGVIGVRLNDKKENALSKVYYGLYAMQHRGQESCGVAIFDGKEIKLHKDMGLVSEVFRDLKLEGFAAIGHVRYSTKGESQLINAQPLLIDYSYGSFAIAHNGQIVNYKELKAELSRKGCVFTTTTDSEIIAQVIVQEHIKSGDFILGIKRAMRKIKGSYSLTILKDDKIIAIRDPNGFRPLVLGKRGSNYIVASESCAIECVNFKVVRDVKPGEILIISESIRSEAVPSERKSICMFEYVYFSRPDSVIDGIPVYQVRKKLGELLYKEAPIKADLVTAVPDSGITAALGFSRASGIPYGESLIKNRYLGRTFIMPNQKDREEGVKIKLMPLKSEIKDKVIVLVDDSIVRGTTIKRIISNLKEAGAKEVHVRISCPPIRYPCYYGIDMQTREEFIARNKTVEEIKEEIGADSLAYISLDGLIKAIGLPREKLCLACLTGEYPVKPEQMKLTN